MKYSLIALVASSIPWGAFAGHGHHHHHKRQSVSQSHGQCVPPQVPRPCTTIVTSYLVPVEHSVVPTTALTDNYTIPNVTVTEATTLFITQTSTSKVVITVPEPTSDHGNPIETPQPTTVDLTVTVVPLPEPTSDHGNPNETPLPTTVDLTVTVVPLPEPTSDHGSPNETPHPTTVDLTVTLVPLPEPTSDHGSPNETPHPTTVDLTVTLVPLPEPSISTKGPEIIVTPVTTATTPIKEQPSTPPNGQIKPAWAITYSPYNDDKSCKTKEQVESDIVIIAGKGIKNIRLYSSDCNGLDTVGPACEKHGIKIILGIFIRDASCRADDDLKRILAWKRWDQIVMFVVANEALLNGYCTAGQLAGYITEVRGNLKNAGYTGLITTTEPLNMIEQYHATICPVIDVVSINCHPYFNPDNTADQAGPFLNAQLKEAQKLCGKDAYVLEAGWPSAGNTNGKAIASPAAQKTAFESFQQYCPTDTRVVYFTFRNDNWKIPGAFNVEQHFGCGNLLG